jgi:hypothetical protein
VGNTSQPRFCWWFFSVHPHARGEHPSQPVSHHPANPKNDDIYTPDAEFDAKSCRDYLTLTSGLWAINNFRAGDATEMEARKNSCSFHFYSNQIISVNTKPTLDFSDTNLYSREVVCGENDNCGAKSFGEMIKDKELTAVSPDINPP